MAEPDASTITTMCSATLLGARTEISLEELTAVLAATATAGFSAVSLWGVHHLGLVGKGVDPDAIVSLHGETGLAVPVVEAALGWTRGATSDLETSVLPILEVAARYGAEQVLAVCMEPDVPDPQACLSGFGRLCDLAAEHGLRVSLEFLPWTGIPDLRSAWRLVQDCERENAGLTLDSWHWQRQPGGPDFETLSRIPGERIHFLQLSDAAAEPWSDLEGETLQSRHLPGDGTVDFARLREALVGIGAQPVTAPEVFSAEWLARGPSEMAQRIAASTRAVWAEAPAPSPRG